MASFGISVLGSLNFCICRSMSRVRPLKMARSTALRLEEPKSPYKDAYSFCRDWTTSENPASAACWTTNSYSLWSDTSNLLSSKSSAMFSWSPKRAYSRALRIPNFGSAPCSNSRFTILTCPLKQAACNG